MSVLSMVEAKLPPGFRFHPSDDELVCDYLTPKASGDGDSGLYHHPMTMMIDVDLNKCEPWDLPEMALVGDKEWYFFSVKDRKYATGQRTNRATLSGYWKATGKDKPIMRKGVLIGMRKTLVFYQGRAPKGSKTEWVMHEFRIEGHDDPPKSSLMEDWVLCRVFYKSRGIPAKTSAESYYEDTGSSSLPPLTEAYIAFNQSFPNAERIEQVPCFSSLLLNPASLESSFQHFPSMEISMTNKNLAHLRSLPDLGSCLNTLSCDNKVITSVLSHLTKLEANQWTSDGCFSETGLSSVWNPY